MLKLPLDIAVGYTVIYNTNKNLHSAKLSGSESGHPPKVEFLANLLCFVVDILKVHKILNGTC